MISSISAARINGWATGFWQSVKIDLSVMNIELTEEEAATLLRQLNEIIDGDRYFLSPRIKTFEGGAL